MSPRKKADESAPEAGTINFEQAFSRLEEIVDKMETGEFTLQQSIDAFEEGMSLYKTCRDQLKAAELKLKKLMPQREPNEADNEEEPEPKESSED